MSLLNDMADYLEAQGVGTKATNIFMSYMPESPDALSVLYDHGGPAPLILGNGLRQESPELQVLTRALDYPTAETAARAVYTALLGCREQTINGTRYISVLPISQPFFLERDHIPRVIFSCNYSLEVAR